MDLDEIRRLLESALEDSQIEIHAEGNKLALDLVSEKFMGMNRVKRQQFVYTLLNDKISSGEIHAVTMKTRTPDEAATTG